MSCHLSHRLTTIHRAVSMALLYSVAYAALVSSAQAATIGKTVITSAQHEPLAASIMVTDIKTADFSASLANSTIYQQMGLTPTDSMTVRFQPTSATSGQVFITTVKPVSTPFADVVLAINDGEQRNVIPKTLLMPINASLPTAPAKNTVTEAKKPNLPVISVTDTQPLTVRKGTPPPLLLSPDSSIANVAAIATTTASNTTAYKPNRLENGRSDSDHLNNNSNISNNVAITGAQNDNIIFASSLDNSAPATTGVDKKLDILNIQITRQIQPNSKNSIGVMTATPTLSNNSTDTIVANTPLDKVPVSEVPYRDMPSNSMSSDQIVTQRTSSSNNISATDMNSNTSNSSAKFNYTVQRNDNLWVIAQQIAEKNNLDVKTVMNEIQSQNPGAFINKNADQLKADAQLSLPNYDVIPSQKNLQAAISAQRQYNRKANTGMTKKPTTPKSTSQTQSEATQAANRTEKLATTKTQILPKAQFSVLAPGHDGSADGTKTKAGMAAGNGLSTDVLTILKSSRQSTASQAERLSKTSSVLDSYNRKLELQNQKLAELQARLKKLRNQ